MNKDSFKLYEIDENVEKRLWEKCVFVFDTSVLLDFYSYPQETVIDIFSKILDSLHHEQRLWIPNHVQFEFLKNREEVISKVVKDTYGKLKKENLAKVFSGVTQIHKNLEQVKKKTCNNERHPYLDQSPIDGIIDSLAEFNEKIEAFKTTIDSAIESEVTKIENLKVNDYILKGFKEYLRVGNNYNFSKILKIVEEGNLRYPNQIPPGYMDEKDPNKKGTQIFGDLIVWKQILDYAGKSNRDVVFICNDLKEDWCYVDSRNRIISPRYELIKEFNDIVKRKFWMYNQAQFLYKSNAYLESRIDNSKIKEVDKLIVENKPVKVTRNSRYLVFKCKNCGTINTISDFEALLDFEAISGSERGMGQETHYQSFQPFLCKRCDDEIKVWFNIWEYPIGSHNFEDFEIENGILLEHPDFVSGFWEKAQDLDSFDEDYFYELQSEWEPPEEE